MKRAQLKLKQAKRRLRMCITMFWILATLTVMCVCSLVSGITLGVTSVLAADPAVALGMSGFWLTLVAGPGAAFFWSKRDDFELRVVMHEENLDREIQYETDRILRAA